MAPRFRIARVIGCGPAGINAARRPSACAEAAGLGEHGSFPGAFVGMVVFDITGRALPADFTRFSYSPG